LFILFSALFVEVRTANLAGRRFFSANGRHERFYFWFGDFSSV
jgi:hypothetical protein